VTTETIATEVRLMWNVIAPFVIAWAESMPESELHPIRIGITEGFDIGSHKREFIRFQFGPLEDRRVVSAIIANMAALLRCVSQNHVIVVLGCDGVGFGLRHDGADDMTLQEIWPDVNHA
jgi:hypothetical protein